MLKQSILRGAILAALALSSPAYAAGSDVANAGVFEVYHNGELVEIVPNLVPKAARSYLLRSGVALGAQIGTWYGALYINDLAPTDDLTAANFPATLDEFVNYTETARPTWAQDAEANQAIENTTTLMSFTIGTGGGTVSGIALTSVNTKDATTGTLLAATKFSAPRTVLEGDVLQFRYKLQANAA